MYLVLDNNNSIILQTNEFEEVNKTMTLNREIQIFLNIDSIPLLIDSLERELEKNKSLQEEITLLKEDNFQFKELVKELNKDKSEMERIYYLAKKLVDELNEDLEKEVEKTRQLQQVFPAWI